jgi:hypothetical protein
MQVSRLLTRIMADLRRGLEGSTESREPLAIDAGSRDAASAR